MKKFTYGHGLVIGMVAFISFIMYFVVSMLSDDQYDHELVVEDYYKEELHFQQEIDAETNANFLEETIQLKQSDKGISINFPENDQFKEVTGAIRFYRPSNERLDFEIPVENINGKQFFISESRLPQGRWNIKIEWTQAGKTYLVKRQITY